MGSRDAEPAAALSARVPCRLSANEIPFPFRVRSRVCEEENFPPGSPPLTDHDPIERHPEVHPSGGISGSRSHGPLARSPANDVPRRQGEIIESIGAVMAWSL